MTQIGTSTLNVYPLCLGTNTFGWTSTPEQSHLVLDDYTAAGGNFIDTADVYSAWAPGNQGGESETIIGSWLAKSDRRAEVVLATKVGKMHPHDSLSATSIQAGAEESLRRLGTDYIDLYYAHAEDSQTPLEESIAAFAALVESGKIRYVGLSNFSAEAISRWFELAPPAVRPVALQPHYNLLYRSEFEQLLCPVAKQFDLAVMPYFSLAAGALSGKYHNQPVTGPRAEQVRPYLGDGAEEVIALVAQIADAHNVDPAAVAIAWLLAQPTVAAPIASARIPEQLPALLEGATVALSDDEVRRLDLASAKK